jgi:murein DD-endopeptidase MepM/ murein hydrolase activator NlpD
LKNAYTILLMSSNQDSVRQFSINRWLALSLGLFFCLVFSLTINFAVSGIKHGIRYRAELQGEVASREELENAVRNYKEDHQSIQEEIQDVRKMNKTIRKYLGIDSEIGVLGRGGGGSSTEEVNDDELTNPIIEPQLAPTPAHTEVAKGALIDQIVQVKRELIPIYDRVVENADQLYETPWILPILVSNEDEGLGYWFSSGFGRRPHPLTGKLQFHNGLDIAAPWATPVIATANGVIEQMTKDPFFGNMVQIEHKTSQMKTLYGHLKNHADGLQIGQQIKRGEIIGYVGNSGRSTGTHLHYGVYANGKWQNPQYHIILDDPIN